MHCCPQNLLVRSWLSRLPSTELGRLWLHRKPELHLIAARQPCLDRPSRSGFSDQKRFRTHASKDDLLKGVDPQHRDDVARVVEQAQRAASMWTTICTGAHKCRRHAETNLLMNLEPCVHIWDAPLCEGSSTCLQLVGMCGQSFVLAKVCRDCFKELRIHSGI